MQVWWTSSASNLPLLKKHLRKQKVPERLMENQLVVYLYLLNPPKGISPRGNILSFDLHKLFASALQTFFWHNLAKPLICSNRPLKSTLLSWKVGPGRYHLRLSGKRLLPCQKQTLAGTAHWIINTQGVRKGSHFHGPFPQLWNAQEVVWIHTTRAKSAGLAAESMETCLWLCACVVLLLSYFVLYQ